MAGTWMSIVEGFGGMLVRNNVLHFNPLIPAQWKSLSFKITYRRALLQVTIEGKKVTIENQSGQTIQLSVNSTLHQLKAMETYSNN